MGPNRAIVLSGGGARGAYEAGVLAALCERAVQQRVPTITDVVCGTSVGAITGALLAAFVDDPGGASSRLESTWSALALEDVLAFRLGHLRDLPALFLGGDRAVGLFDGEVLARLVHRHIAWAQIGQHLDAGRLAALTVTATHVPTGRPVVFVQRRPDVSRPDKIGRRVVVRDTTIGLDHVLASAAIPVLFPPVRVGGDLYCDGGLRLNTPIGPAVRLGARKVLVIGLSTLREVAELASGRYPGASFLLGKVLNAFLLDHVMSDLEELGRFNRLLAEGELAYGPEFEARLAAIAEERGLPALRRIEATVVRPSEDLAELAVDHLRRLRRSVRRVSAARVLLRVIDSRETAGSDLASYLLFDRSFARALIDLGRQDALRDPDALDRFLAG